MNELMNLTDDELNARAARALGWEEVSDVMFSGVLYWRHNDMRLHKENWHPTSNLYQAFRLQEEVAKRGLQRSYGYILENLLLSKTTFWTSWFGMSWEVAASTARTRTIAAVYVLEGAK